MSSRQKIAGVFENGVVRLLKQPSGRVRKKVRVEFVEAKQRKTPLKTPKPVQIKFGMFRKEGVKEMSLEEFKKLRRELWTPRTES